MKLRSLRTTAAIAVALSGLLACGSNSRAKKTDVSSGVAAASEADAAAATSSATSSPVAAKAIATLGAPTTQPTATTTPNAVPAEALALVAAGTGNQPNAHQSKTKGIFQNANRNSNKVTLLDMQATTIGTGANQTWGYQPYQSTDNGATWTAVGTGFTAVGTPNGGVRAVDYNDGSWLVLSPRTASFYNDATLTSLYSAGGAMILYANRLNTFVPNNLSLYDQNCAASHQNCDGYYTFRIMLFGSTDWGLTWSQFAPFAVAVSPTIGAATSLAGSGPTPNFSTPRGLWSNSIFERSDGQVTVYFDSSESAYLQVGQGQFTAQSTLCSLSVGAATSCASVPPVARGPQTTADLYPASLDQGITAKPQRGMATVSEVCRNGSGTITYVTGATNPNGVYHQSGIICTYT